ncbi:MAG: hypothetical protein MRY83_14645, partial [Flavobacteriales bacterium]|nr:hypothetical protein [Flavobacteriales bacterium]
HELYLFATIIVGPMLFMKSGVLLLYQYYLLFKGTKQKLAYYLSLFWMPVLVIGVTLLVKYL